ncbi:hypothetical protein Back11_05810 [Paenibacillus baekrokdamisoli]|uniref:Uncharacterized protein n=1 Tax=Paenibacillus baekrokdamisoli TaxID=1712516 RepID=A0A3G9ILM0_9BACL|nr:hypothetical protein Back11_05810 [Paenibacillus baekrokdamisoli]
MGFSLCVKVLEESSHQSYHTKNTKGGRHLLMGSIGIPSNRYSLIGLSETKIENSMLDKLPLFHEIYSCEEPFEYEERNI